LKTVSGFDSNSRSRDNLIKTRQMEAILKCIEFIRAGELQACPMVIAKLFIMSFSHIAGQHENEFWIFLPTIDHPMVKILVAKIKCGCQHIQDFMLESCTVRECAAALFSFLRSLDEGLLPLRMQQLIKASNSCVPVSIIAFDALGCLIEESRHEMNNFIVTVELLQMMRLLSTEGSLRPSETSPSQAPFFLMPILFDKQVASEIIMNFTQCMNIVHEIILQSSVISPNYRAAWKELRAAEATVNWPHFHNDHQLFKTICSLVSIPQAAAAALYVISITRFIKL
jgi:hypothetical protein